MSNFHNVSGNDIKLISKVKINDDDSIRLLFNKYLPLVKTFYRTYSVRGMDLDDWKQESIIVMLKCARRYQVGSQYRFSTLYRTGLRNRFVDLIRRQNAKRRVPTNVLTSFEANEVLYANTLEDIKATCPEKFILTKELLGKVLQSCSPFEKKILLNIIRRTPEKIALENRCSLDQIIGAFERCKRKFRRICTTKSD